MIYELFIQPFTEHDYMRRAIAACIAMSVAGAPLGLFLVLRRLSLAGDALSHSILPGVAIAYIFAGATFWSLTLGGLIAGVAVSFITVLVSRSTGLKEDASFAAAYMLSLAAGIMIISTKGDEHEILHMLFGHIESISQHLVYFTAAVASISLIGLAIIYRPLVMECVDPVFLRSVRGKGALYHHLFLILIVLNLVCVFQALGTLLALGIMLIPAIAGRFWSKNIDGTIIAGILIAIGSSFIGLLVAYHNELPIGPSVVLCAGAVYILSIIFGKNGGLIRKLLPHHHLAE